LQQIHGKNKNLWCCFFISNRTYSKYW